jgi:hypothetical protein
MESGKKMIAFSLNKTVESSFFDLFNKSFLRRNGEDVYRVSMESNVSLTSIFNPKSNVIVIMNENEFRN